MKFRVQRKGLPRGCFIEHLAFSSGQQEHSENFCQQVLKLNNPKALSVNSFLLVRKDKTTEALAVLDAIVCKKNLVSNLQQLLCSFRYHGYSRKINLALWDCGNVIAMRLFHVTHPQEYLISSITNHLCKQIFGNI